MRALIMSSADNWANLPEICLQMTHYRLGRNRKPQSLQCRSWSYVLESKIDLCSWLGTYNPGDSRTCGRLLVSISCTPGLSHSAIISCLWATRMDVGSYSKLINVFERGWPARVSLSELATKESFFARSISFHPCPARTTMSLESELPGASIFRRFVSMKKRGERHSCIFWNTRRGDFGEASVAVAGYEFPDSYSSLKASSMVFIVLISTSLILSSSEHWNDDAPDDVELYNDRPNMPFTFEMSRGEGQLKIFSYGYKLEHDVQEDIRPTFQNRTLTSIGKANK